MIAPHPQYSTRDPEINLIVGLSPLALIYLEFRWFMTRVKCWWKHLCDKLAAGPLPCTGLGAHGDEYSGMPSGPPDPVRQRRLLTQKAWGPNNQGEWRHFPYIQHHYTGLITPTIVGGDNKNRQTDKQTNTRPHTRTRAYTHTHTHTRPYNHTGGGRAGQRMILRAPSS